MLKEASTVREELAEKPPSDAPTLLARGAGDAAVLSGLGLCNVTSPPPEIEVTVAPEGSVVDHVNFGFAVSSRAGPAVYVPTAWYCCGTPTPTSVTGELAGQLGGEEPLAGQIASALSTAAVTVSVTGAEVFPPLVAVICVVVAVPVKSAVASPDAGFVAGFVVLKVATVVSEEANVDWLVMS